VSSLVGANVLVCGIFLCSTRIPHARGQNTFHITENFLHAPETSRAECRFLRLHAKTMRPLHHMRNQMLAAIRDLTCLHWSHFHALKSNSAQLRSLLLQMP